MDDPKRALAGLARRLYRRGWMEGTGGNLSLREGDRIFITPSGLHKGRIRPEEILEMTLEGTPLSPGQLRPSAETSIHLVLYRILPKIRAVIHVHTPEAVVASTLGKSELSLPPLEVIKGLGYHDPTKAPPIPIFENDLSVEQIAGNIKLRMEKANASLPALLIRHHGTTAWGESIDDALRHIELVEFCFRVLLESRQ
ncbi:MAG: methylthioribulose 1-phosphate dehydratase [Leptospirales bacterium]